MGYILFSKPPRGAAKLNFISVIDIDSVYTPGKESRKTTRLLLSQLQKNKQKLGFLMCWRSRN